MVRLPLIVAKGYNMLKGTCRVAEALPFVFLLPFFSTSTVSERNLFQCRFSPGTRFDPGELRGAHRAYEQDLCGGLSIAALFFQHAGTAVRCQDLFLWELLEVSWVFRFIYLL